MMRAYTTLDVFTTAPFTGNPLAVVWEAEGLSEGQMQSLAREFGYSETVFVLPSSSCDVRVRIFTPLRELPFAGHPNVGLAVAKALREKSALPVRWVFEEAIGDVEVWVERCGEDVQAQVKAPVAFALEREVTAAEVASLVGLNADSLVSGRHPPMLAGAGLPFIFAELRSRACLAAASSQSVSCSGVQGVMVQGVMVYVRDENDPHSVHTRMFSADASIREDPATGSAALGLGGLLSRTDQKLGTWRMTQGEDMGRKSSIAVTVTGGDLFLLGSAVPVMEGRLTSGV